ncbi:MAG: hypothetical protein KI785_10805 [Devosiaceae bacterium]|nr:hypothetical protein [Devosiaceae bacterium MH13]
MSSSSARLKRLCPLIVCLLLPACQSLSVTPHDGTCVFRAIPVSDAVAAHLRAPLATGDQLPDGYENFIRELSAHNRKIAALCAAEPGPGS